MSIVINDNLAQFLIRVADTEIILGQRLAAMCSRAPFLEEDIALSNLALDLFGRGEDLLKIISKIEGEQFSQDDYTFRRNEREDFCLKLVEQPNQDFAWVIVRQYFHDVYIKEVFTQLLAHPMQEISALSEKVLKEIAYSHLHVKDWMERLGLGTDESNARMQLAIDSIWKFMEEIFKFDDLDKKYLKNADQIFSIWNKEVSETLNASNLKRPEDIKNHIRDYRDGFHTEHLGLMLTEMQYLPRAYPDAKW